MTEREKLFVKRYGMSADQLAEVQPMNMSQDEAARLIERFYQAFPHVRDYWALFDKLVAKS